ncbi:hypothetical protein Sste5346_008889 [Sporothrix stenoceras]|uniref:Uncharacterized protein n=1 Tax=Sporothrix stenoceras TaxID=5173 RepID=A0ABR3YNT4_9PEZI
MNLIQEGWTQLDRDMYGDMTYVQFRENLHLRLHRMNEFVRIMAHLQARANYILEEVRKSIETLNAAYNGVAIDVNVVADVLHFQYLFRVQPFARRTRPDRLTVSQQQWFAQHIIEQCVTEYYSFLAFVNFDFEGGPQIAGQLFDYGNNLNVLNNTEHTWQPTNGLFMHKTPAWLINQDCAAIVPVLQDDANRTYTFLFVLLDEGLCHEDNTVNWILYLNKKLLHFRPVSPEYGGEVRFPVPGV